MIRKQNTSPKSILTFTIFQVNYLTNEYTNKEMPESAWCAVPWNESGKGPLYFMIISTFVAFVIPFTLVTVLYFR